MEIYHGNEWIGSLIISCCENSHETLCLQTISMALVTNWLVVVRLNISSELIKYFFRWSNYTPSVYSRSDDFDRLSAILFLEQFLFNILWFGSNIEWNILILSTHLYKHKPVNCFQKIRWNTEQGRRSEFFIVTFWLASFAYIVNSQVIVALQTNNSPNPFFPNTPFLYPLKTSENRKVFWSFQGVEKRCIGNEWINSESTVLNNCILDREIFLTATIYTISIK